MAERASGGGDGVLPLAKNARLRAVVLLLDAPLLRPARTAGDEATADSGAVFAWLSGEAACAVGDAACASAGAPRSPSTTSPVAVLTSRVRPARTGVGARRGPPLTLTSPSLTPSLKRRGPGAQSTSNFVPVTRTARGPASTCQPPFWRWNTDRSAWPPNRVRWAFRRNHGACNCPRVALSSVMRVPSWNSTAHPRSSGADRLSSRAREQSCERGPRTRSAVIQKARPRTARAGMTRAKRRPRQKPGRAASARSISAHWRRSGGRPSAARAARSPSKSQWASPAPTESCRLINSSLLGSASPHTPPVPARISCGSRLAGRDERCAA